MTEKTIGILGGMGPAATVDFFKKIVMLTDASKDSDHIPVIVYNNPKIPDRTRAILGLGPSPLPMLKEGAVFLREAGADIIVMPCITAHLFYSDLVRAVDIPILNLIDETLAFFHRRNRRARNLGLLATAGTYKTGIWEAPARKVGMNIVVPEEPFIQILMDAIYGNRGIKSGFKIKARTQIAEVIEHLKGAGIEGAVLGCTELSLISRLADVHLPVANPLVIGARSVIRQMGYSLAAGRSPA